MAPKKPEGSSICPTDDLLMEIHLCQTKCSSERNKYNFSPHIGSLNDIILKVNTFQGVILTRFAGLHIEVSAVKHDADQTLRT
jgi:hypothetical protein